MTELWRAIAVHQEASGETQEEALENLARKLDEVIPGQTEAVVCLAHRLEYFRAGFLPIDAPKSGDESDGSA